MNKAKKAELWHKIFDDGLVLEVKFPNLSSIDAESFKKLRNELNFSQQKFADIIGVSKKAIEKWEQGKNPITGAAKRLIYLIHNDHSLIERLYYEARPMKQEKLVEEACSSDFTPETDKLIGMGETIRNHNASTNRPAERKKFVV